ncbi:MAG: FAD:protein FMN transferase [Verrucomicrobiaceae bacterium]|nr:MAG: FAD:protein FMN transferase [Verrucomicrobiaceae bacterium]
MVTRLSSGAATAAFLLFLLQGNTVAALSGAPPAPAETTARQPGVPADAAAAAAAPESKPEAAPASAGESKAETPPSSPTPAPVPALERFEYMRPQMGSPFKITLYARDKESGDKAAEAGFARAQQLNAILSDYQKDSELSRLSATAGGGRAVPVSDDLWRILELSIDMAARTDGALDITVGPLVDLWRARPAARA